MLDFQQLIKLRERVRKRAEASPMRELPPFPLNRPHLSGRNRARGQTARSDLKSRAAMQSPVRNSPVRPGYHRVEVQKTTWDVPERYATLLAIGSGAYGTVW